MLATIKKTTIALGILGFATVSSLHAASASTTNFKRISPHFIAALGDPTANSGSEASTWGYWDYDPGKTGVWLSLFPVLKAAGGYGPGNWK